MSAERAVDGRDRRRCGACRMTGGRRVRVTTTVLAAVTATVLALVACGTPSADLFVVQRTGSIPGARLKLRVTDGGAVSCNGGPLKPISSAELIEARATLHDLEGAPLRGTDDVQGPIDRSLHLPPGPNTVLSYSVRGETGTVAFSDSSRGQPPAFRRTAALVRELAKGPCGLER